MMWEAEKAAGDSPGVCRVGVVALISAGVPAGGQAKRLPVIPSPVSIVMLIVVGMMGCAVLRSTESIRRRVAT
jgi:hypothetical protein